MQSQLIEVYGLATNSAQEKIVKHNKYKRADIKKCCRYVWHMMMGPNVLHLLLTFSLRDSDTGYYPVFIQVNDFVFRAGLVTCPRNTCNKAQ